MSLWTSEEIKLATDGKVIGEWVVDGISIDTRNLVKGDLFTALLFGFRGLEGLARV